MNYGLERILFSPTSFFKNNEIQDNLLICCTAAMCNITIVLKVIFSGNIVPTTFYGKSAAISLPPAQMIDKGVAQQ